MKERFELFRLSLLMRQQRDAFAGPDPTREDYLRSVFSERRTFKFYGTEFHYVPEAVPSRTDVIMARIGRPVTVAENKPPEEGFADTLHDGWRAAVVIIDPSHHEDGQKVAVGEDNMVGSPKGLIQALVAAINETNPTTAYDVEVEPIVNALSFWQFAARHKGQLTSLTFEFVPPNMFGGTENLSEELREFRKKENAEKVVVKLISSEGIDTDTDRTRESVDYIAKGAGNIRAKTKSGLRFNSTKKVASTTVDAKDMPDEPTLARLSRLASRILGRE
jgi:hypothetical protein